MFPGYVEMARGSWTIGARYWIRADFALLWSRAAVFSQASPGPDRSSQPETQGAHDTTRAGLSMAFFGPQLSYRPGAIAAY